MQFSFRIGSRQLLAPTFGLGPNLRALRLLLLKMLSSFYYLIRTM
jgi:hypothetical protein